MNVDVIFTPLEAEPSRIEGRSVVVIDVFRATSCICTALENGASRIIALSTVEQCVEMRSKLALNDSMKVLLGGERKMVKIDGFDLDNSPASYSKEVVEDATIIMSTTNGTRSIELSVTGGAKNVLVGSMFNATAVAKRLIELGDDVVIFCAGRQDRFSVEDTLCAGYIASLLRSIGGVELRDVAWWVADSYERNIVKVDELMLRNTHYLRMTEIGIQSDALHCLKSDIYNSVPHLDNGVLVIK